MSMKGKARMAAAEAVGDLGKVMKLRGNIIVLRKGNGRTRDWHRAVYKTVATALPYWEVISKDKDRMEFKCLLSRGEKP